MRLTPHEVEKTTVLMGVCAVAQKRLASGLRLNLPEAEGLIAGQLIHLARSNQHSVASLMSVGRSMLGRKQVLAGEYNFSQSISFLLLLKRTYSPINLTIYGIYRHRRIAGGSTGTSVRFEFTSL